MANDFEHGGNGDSFDCPADRRAIEPHPTFTTGNILTIILATLAGLSAYYAGQIQQGNLTVRVTTLETSKEKQEKLDYEFRDEIRNKLDGIHSDLAVLKSEQARRR